MTYLLIIICGIVGGALPVLLASVLFSHQRGGKITGFAVAFSAGVLLASAFFDLIPEALTQSDNKYELVSLFILTGLVFFFLFEGLFHWFHKHAHTNEDDRNPHENECNEHNEHNERHGRALNVMVMVGDSVHNFFDGIAIASGFLIGNVSGILVTLAVMLHEMPQEVADFGIMLNSGMKKRRVLFLNLLSAVFALVSTLIFYTIGSHFENMIKYPFIAIVSGFFIYIATTDIIPTIHEEKNRLTSILKMLCLIVGIAIMATIIVFVGE
ncbi:MAG: ZIP family metal transporter [Christensenellaceae bacterium]|jgi:zinc and cadmium transporter|nr:ZIP family metal transporter [Christensenellaceae bacterium]